MCITRTCLSPHYMYIFTPEQVYVYCIAGKVGKEFNLSVWKIDRPTSKLQSVKITLRAMYACCALRKKSTKLPVMPINSHQYFWLYGSVYFYGRTLIFHKSWHSCIVLTFLQDFIFANNMVRSPHPLCNH